MSLTFKELEIQNLSRCEISFDHDPKTWSVAEWTNALCGEAGEAANIAKKLLRKEQELERFVDDPDVDILRDKLGSELADVVIYADLVAQRLGLSLGSLVANKFNETSEKYNAGERLKTDA